jgi:hypothetical protein
LGHIEALVFFADALPGNATAIKPAMSGIDDHGPRLAEGGGGEGEDSGEG